MFATGALACLFNGATTAQSADTSPSGYSDPLDAATLKEINSLYRRLIEAENRHDLASVRAIVWDSPSTLFVAKTATPEEGNWAGFWGTEVVVRHFAELYGAGPFRIDPDYDKLKVVGLTRDVAETYVPVNITVSYAGQIACAKTIPDDPHLASHAARLADGKRHRPAYPAGATLLMHHGRTSTHASAAQAS